MKISDKQRIDFIEAKNPIMKRSPAGWIVFFDWMKPTWEFTSLRAALDDRILSARRRKVKP